MVSGAEMRLIAFVTDGATVRNILASHVDLSGLDVSCGNGANA
jgi:hypothetical protein